MHNHEHSFAYDGFGLKGKGRMWHDNYDEVYPKVGVRLLPHFAYKALT